MRLILLLILLLTLVEMMTMSIASRSVVNPYNKESRCEDLKMPLCRGLWYSRTRMPNMFHHESQEEAGIQAQQFVHLVTIKCSPDLHFFLCSIYTPICVDNYDKPLPPCRSICERSRDGCAPILKSYGFSWPAQMTCDQFPEKSTDNQLCMEVDSKSTSITTDTVTTSFTTTTTPSKSKIIHKPLSPILGIQTTPSHNIVVNKTTVIRRNETFHKNSNCACKCRPPLITISNSHHAYYNKVHTGPVSNCALPCVSPLISHQPTYNLVSTGLSIAVGLILTLGLLNIITVAVNKAQLMLPPHRFILYISTTQMGVTCGVIIRLITGHRSMVCFSSSPPPTLLSSPSSSTQSLLFLLRFQNSAEPHFSSSLCSISFLLIYFFYLASLLWWVVLCLTWFLSNGLGWTSEMIDRYSQLYHFICWLIPGLLGMLGLTMSVVDGDPVTGLCLVGNSDPPTLMAMLLAPVSICLACGLFFLGCGFYSAILVNKMRPPIINNNNNKMISRPIKKIGNGRPPLTASSLLSTASETTASLSNHPHSGVISKSTTSTYYYGLVGLIIALPICTTTAALVYEVRINQQYFHQLLCPKTCTHPSLLPHPTTLTWVALKYSSFFLPAVICGPWIWPLHAVKLWLVPLVKMLICSGPLTLSNHHPSGPYKQHRQQEYTQTVYEGCYPIQAPLTTISSLSHHKQRLHSLEPSGTNDSLLMSSVVLTQNNSIIQQRAFHHPPVPPPPVSNIDSDSYASYQSLSHISTSTALPYTHNTTTTKTPVTTQNWPLV